MRFPVLALAAFLTCTAVAHAQTGSISGAVFDQDGRPVADASVRIVGDPLPAGRTTRTDTNGVYLFGYLLPGAYVVSVDGSVVSPPSSSSVHPAAIIEISIGKQMSERRTRDIGRESDMQKGDKDALSGEKWSRSRHAGKACSNAARISGVDTELYPQ